MLVSDPGQYCPDSDSQQTEAPVAESSAVTRPASLPQTLGEMLAPSAAFSAPGMMTQSKPRVAVPLEP